MTPQEYFYKEILALQTMAKARKSTRKGEKKSPPKNTIKDVIKESVQPPPPKAITPPERLPERRDSKKTS
jgi:hypothetical protein